MILIFIGFPVNELVVCVSSMVIDVWLDCTQAAGAVCVWDVGDRQSSDVPSLHIMLGEPYFFFTFYLCYIRDNIKK